VVAAAVLTAALCFGLPASATTAVAATNAAYQVSGAEQAATAAFWTPQRMASATASDTSVADTSVSAGSADGATPADGAPPGTPTGSLFDGVPTVGALFSTTGGKAHFCTASVVLSVTRNLVLTAAHCVNGGKSGSGYRTNLAFVPGYHDGIAPFGTWAAQSILVAGGWQTSSDPNLDFAFITVGADAQGRQIQDLTGGNQLGVDRGYDHTVTVIGYPNVTEQPVICGTISFQAMPSQLQFNCHGYPDGTSGGPWLIDYNPDTGSGTVIGDIGGYETGGNYEYTSYSPYFGAAILKLYVQAELKQI